MVLSSMGAFTIMDSYNVTHELLSSLEHVLDVKFVRDGGVTISLWWNSGNSQLVTHNLATDEFYSCEDIQTDEALACAILRVMFISFSSWVID